MVATWKTIAIVGITASAQAAVAQSAATLANQAKAIIAERMIDPASLQVRNTQSRTATVEGRTVTILCGEYNSRNRMGGYAGFKRFVYDPTVMQGVLAFEPDLRLNFFSQNGSGDVSHDPGPAIRAGADPDRIAAAHERATNFAVAYLPVCLNLTARGQ